jgi:hypothetical protein
MSVQQFYLLGEPVSTKRSIDLDSTLDYDGLRNLIAAHFAIVEPNGEYLSQ